MNFDIKNLQFSKKTMNFEIKNYDHIYYCQKFAIKFQKKIYIFREPEPNYLSTLKAFCVLYSGGCSVATLPFIQLSHFMETFHSHSRNLSSFEYWTSPLFKSPLNRGSYRPTLQSLDHSKSECQIDQILKGRISDPHSIRTINFNRIPRKFTFLNVKNINSERKL